MVFVASAYGDLEIKDKLIAHLQTLIENIKLFKSYFKGFQYARRSHSEIILVKI
jgi:hypothetical protein